ncbi:MAG TPA: beta-eliminating lyase-related protein [Microbacteriaceae bacterium]|jgi:threonine aldolase|nr:beta-eliminating lyase-related protein [Microbacteriaceae bacterium]HQZ46929.1 beta-eliminating lyase-related protein [Microbacteriaceae bacterium]HRA08059.1 beta-eliminating lyase-related protein [Microbacteriaceae bacterium]
MDSLHDANIHHFASDNHAGAHPDVLAALAAANGGHQDAYGADAYTARLDEVLEGHFGTGVDVYPVFNGTGANVVGLQSMLPRWGGVITARTAHINVDENGAPERIGGMKLLALDTPDGKLRPEQIDREVWGWGDEHRAQPLVVSITQSTELGTNYTPEEVRAIADAAHSQGLRLHLDGARIANAAASLGVPLRAFTTDAGVDVLSLGGTKNGAIGAEAIVVLRPEASEGLRYLRKLNMQLGSKQRFASAQLIALFEGQLWRDSAAHANAMATRLRSRLTDAAATAPLTLTFTQPTESNAVFARLPAAAANALRPRFGFYDWAGPFADGTVEVRWMCSWDTTPEHVDAFADAIIAGCG